MTGKRRIGTLEKPGLVLGFFYELAFYPDTTQWRLSKI